jgi:hypothetical protein
VELESVGNHGEAMNGGASGVNGGRFPEQASSRLRPFFSRLFELFSGQPEKAFPTYWRNLKRMRSTLRKTLAFGFAVACLASSANAQHKATIGKLEFDAIPSPDVQTGKAKAFKPKDWLEVEAEITIPPLSAEQNKAGFIDSVTVKWYVAVKNPDGKGVFKLAKDIVHVNVPVNEAVFSSVYLSPNTLKRLTGQDRAGKGAVEVVGIEILVNGVKIGEGTSKMKEGWWNAGSLSDQSSKFPLLNKNETPFKMLWWDRYAEIEEKR